MHPSSAKRAPLRLQVRLCCRFDWGFDMHVDATPLVSVSWLVETLNRGAINVRIIENVRGMRSPESEAFVPTAYLDSHLPNASYMNLQEVSDPNADLEYTAPTEEQFSEYISRKGVKKDHHVVIYDREPKMAFHTSTCRCWWLFKLFGHEKVSILNGGLKAWTENGGQLTKELPKVEVSDYEAKLNPKLIVNFDRIEKHVSTEDSDFVLMDARSESQFTNSSIPKALNVPFSGFFDNGGSLKSAQEVKQRFDSFGIDLSQPLVTHCNMGVSACVLALAASTLGSTVAVYDGSFAEYSKKTQKKD